MIKISLMNATKVQEKIYVLCRIQEFSDNVEFVIKMEK